MWTARIKTVMLKKIQGIKVGQIWTNIRADFWRGMARLGRLLFLPQIRHIAPDYARTRK